MQKKLKINKYVFASDNQNTMDSQFPCKKKKVNENVKYLY